VSVGRATAALRTSALIALGALVVHQLRYLGGGGEEGHGYLHALLPVVLVLAASAIAGTLVAPLVGARAGARAPAGWAACAAALLIIFGLQESAEAALSARQPAGLAAVLGNGGWIAVPLAIAVGRLVSLLLSGLASVERTLAWARKADARRAPAVLGRARGRQARALVREPLSFGLARRPPPVPAG
jgi:hypothetical protein